jgi:ABC-type Fe3+ transport system permease subunit
MGRVLLRRLLAGRNWWGVPVVVLGAWCIVAVLAMQEFSVYEPTGISVVATEVRMVFDTGAFSSSTNQMNIPSGLGVSGTDGGVAGGAGGSLFGQMGELSTLSQRSAAAVVAATPMLALSVVLALVAAVGARRLGSAESIDPGQWPAVLDAGKTVTVVAWLIVALALVVPTIALVVALKRPFSFWRTYMAFSPQVMGSLGVAAIAGIVALGIGLWAAVASDRWLVPLSLLSFLVGGQLLAIAQIRLYNRPWLERWVYDGPIVVVMAYLARFGWVALLGGRATWTRPWRELRELAAIDGAGPMATARRVVWPLVWPVCVAAGVLVMVLSLSEVPATVLLSPVRPPMLVPMLMTWVHTLRSDDMIEGSLLMMALAGGLGVIGVGIGWIGMSMLRRVGRRGGTR